MEYLGWLLTGLVLGAVATYLVGKRLGGNSSLHGNHKLVPPLIRDHVRPLSIDDLTITERIFPFRVRADLQRAVDRLFQDQTRILHFCGVRRLFAHEGIALSDCLVESEHNPAISIPPEHEELDIGEEQPVRVLKSGLWLLEREGLKFIVLLAPAMRFGEPRGLQFQLGMPNRPEATQMAQQFFQHLEDAVLRAESYRGKILSLEESVNSYSGESSGIMVHKLREVEREQVILPADTLQLLERNVIQFVQQRERLSALGLSTRKGILFYGPPGTGKTHTIHYLARALPAHTTLLVSAEQVALLGDYMTLARLLQPSLVVLEDVDLIARDRGSMDSPCEEVLLNKLLNEMDGLKEEADILFILTTNRPESLEAALASRPGRVDQAIEFPLPDEDGRRKLVRLYARGIELPDALRDEIVRRTSGVSAAFIKELMRRTAQFHLEGNGTGTLQHADVDNALDEMLFRGGMLNVKLLGGGDGKIGFCDGDVSRS